MTKIKNNNNNDSNLNIFSHIGKKTIIIEPISITSIKETKNFKNKNDSIIHKKGIE